MKKINLLIFSLIFAVCGAFFSTNDFVYADENEVIQITDEADFISKFKQDNTFSGKDIVLTKNLDFEGYESQLSGLAHFSFTSNFNGNGFAIKNFTYYSTTGTFGIFNEASGHATIENLKVDGTLTYVVEGASFTAGAIVGSGNNVTIKNCEIGKDVTFVIKDQETLTTTALTNFGGVAGVLTNGSVLSNCINYAPISVATTYSSTGTRNVVGGIVGTLTYSTLRYCVNYGNITATADNLSVGGIVGEIGGDSSTIYDAYVASNINASAEAKSGAIIGNVMAEAPDMVVCCYWMADMQGVGDDNYATNPTYFRRVEDWAPISFFTTKANWYGPKYGWDFKLTYTSVEIKNGESGNPYTYLALQCFQEFGFWFDSYVDNSEMVDGQNFVGGTISGYTRFYRYGETVSIAINYKANLGKYFKLLSINRNDQILDESKYTIADDNATAINITGIVASASTAGKYAFKFDVIEFCNVVEVENPEHGGVQRGESSSNASERFDLPLTYRSRAATVSAVDKDIYVFDYWMLYKRTSAGPDGWTLVNSRFSTNQVLSNIEFGRGDYKDEFKLVAVFTDKKAKNVSFAKDKNITSLTFVGKNYEDSAIKVSPNNASAEIIATVKNGYEIEVDLFLNAIARLYGTNADTSAVIQSDPYTNDKNETVYRFVLNMKNISQNDISLALTTRESDDGKGQDLLWLWITLPIVVVLGGGGIVALVLLRRYRFKHGVAKFGGTAGGKTGKGKEKKEKQKKQDYTDFYY